MEQSFHRDGIFDLNGEVCKNIRRSAAFRTFKSPKKEVRLDNENRK